MSTFNQVDDEELDDQNLTTTTESPVTGQGIGVQEFPGGNDEDDGGIGYVYDDDIHKTLLDPSNDPEPLGVKDLDEFFKGVYDYFHSKGFWCYCVEKILKLLSVLFMIAFTSFLFILVDWYGIYACKGQECADVYIIRRDALTRFHFLHKLAILFEIGVLAYWIYLLITYCAKIGVMWRTKNFYCNHLEITESDIQTIEWEEVVHKVVQLQAKKKIYLMKSLDAYDIVNRIMRRDNFLIAMINKEVLNLRVPMHYMIPFWKSKNGVLTQGLLWNLKRIMLKLFDEDFKLREDILRNPSKLRREFIILGVLNMIASPFLLFFIIIYTFFKHSVKIKNSPLALMERRWTMLAQWRFREFNELPHLFQRRMKRSYHPAIVYTEQFPVYILSIVGKTVSFFSSAVAATIIILSTVKNPLLLYFNVLNQNLFWWLTIALLVYAYAKSMVIDENRIFEPKERLTDVCSIIHYCPDHWKEKGHHTEVRDEFLELFQPQLFQFVEELLSIFITPIILCFSLPKNAEKIVKFLDKITVDTEANGHVCGYATFNFNKFGSIVTGPRAEDPLQRSLQGKMLTSYLDFRAHYNRWKVPNELGAQPCEQQLMLQCSLIESRQQQQQQQQQQEQQQEQQQINQHQQQEEQQLEREEQPTNRSAVNADMLQTKHYFEMLDSLYKSHLA